MVYNTISFTMQHQKSETTRQAQTLKGTVAIIPVGNADRQTLEVLRRSIPAVFDLDAFIGSPLPLPPNAFNKKRRQYLASDVLQSLMKRDRQRNPTRILGVADVDLYVPDLNFVFGLAAGIGTLISVTRLRQEFYGLPEDRALFSRRILTEAVHELGHTFGLGHCRNARCVMFFSNSLIDTDRKGPDFCPVCATRLGR